MAFGDFTVTRASTKNILGSAGLYVSVANDTPAFEFNTDGTYRGLLVEPGATNLALRSQEFDNASWAKSDITVTANSIASPDGTTTADTITEGTAGTAVVTQAVTVTSGATVSASVFVKVGTVNDFIRIIITGSVFGNNIATWFRFSTGALSGTASAGTGTGATASVLALPNGWYRITLSGAITGETGYNLSINSASASGSGTRVNNSVYYLWQADLVASPVATSYIVTSGSTVARSADVVSLTGASSLVGQAQGTVYVEGESPNYTTATVRRLLTISDGTTNNRIAISSRASQNRLYSALGVVGGVTDVNIAQSSGATSIVKIGIGYAVNNYSFVVNGTVIGTDTSAGVPACNRVDIGNELGGTQYIGWIRSVALFPTRLSDATIQTLTTL